MGLWRGVSGLLAVLIVFSPAALAQSDIDPPVLVDFDFNPKSIDVTTGPGEVACSAWIIDPVSGVTSANCVFRSPTSIQSASCVMTEPSTGDMFDGTWGCSVTISPFAEEGVWTLSSVQVVDNAGNVLRHFTADLQQAGFPTELQVTSNEDVAPPQLLDFDFNPKSIDVTTGPGEVACSAWIIDPVSGVTSANCVFRSPTSIQSASCVMTEPSTGDMFDGTWGCSVTISPFAEEGVWTLSSVQVVDNAGNVLRHFTADLQQAGFPTELQVTSNEDVAPPQLLDFDFNPKSIDVTTGPGEVACSAWIIDPVSGVTSANCVFRSPTSIQSASCVMTEPSTGDMFDGTWGCSVTISPFAEEGVWTLSSVQVVDNAGNVLRHFTADLQQAGFPTELRVGFVEGEPRTVISAPRDGKRIRGNSVTIRARLVQGNPADLSPSLGVRFDYRASPFGDFAPIPARNPNHPNPDTSYPYFIHWDVSGVPEGDYELRAVAHDLAGTPDPAPETITITIDHAGPADVDEFVNADGRQESQTAVDSAAENKIASGDHTDTSTATDLTLPPGSLLYTTDTAQLVYPDPADEEGQLEQVEQSIDAFIDLSLISGQVDLEAGTSGDLNISYADADQDGVVDGTTIREEDLELRHLDLGTNTYVVVPSIVLTEHNMVHAEPGFLGKFALAGPLTPQMWIGTDKETLTWDAVSMATSYVVYRGLLSTLVDVDLDGLPDGGFGDCMTHLDGDPTDVLFLDPDDPGGGDGFYYLVGFIGSNGATGLGNTSVGLRREPSAACP